MEDNENKSDINNNDFLLYYTKCPYNLVNSLNNENNDSLDLNEDENDNNNNILNGRWSQKEHLLFIKGCLLYGNYWKKVKKYIQTRSCSQIRSHAQKYLNKLNKKYYGDKNNNLDFKLSDEDIKRLANKSKFSDKEMDDAEMHILSIFKGNKEKDKSILLEENDDQDLDNINTSVKNKSFKSSKSSKSSTKGEKIFNIIKVSKEEKEIERLKMEKEENKNNENSELEDILNEFKVNMNDNNGKKSNDENNEEMNKSNKKHKGKNNEKKILKEDIMLDMTDKNLLYENEVFINKCLDSKDPKDLVKLLTYFGNDINFKVNDVKILNKYQDYLGLDIDYDNSEDNVDNNSKNKEINDDVYPIADNSMNDKTSNNMYPYIYNQPNNSFQYNPLIINPTFMNQY